jgi:hypothetical protein
MLQFFGLAAVYMWGAMVVNLHTSMDQLNMPSPSRRKVCVFVSVPSAASFLTLCVMLAAGKLGSSSSGLYCWIQGDALGWSWFGYFGPMVVVMLYAVFVMISLGSALAIKRSSDRYRCPCLLFTHPGLTGVRTGISIIFAEIGTAVLSAISYAYVSASHTPLLAHVEDFVLCNKAALLNPLKVANLHIMVNQTLLAQVKEIDCQSRFSSDSEPIWSAYGNLESISFVGEIVLCLPGIWLSLLFFYRFGKKRKIVRHNHTNSPMQKPSVRVRSKASSKGTKIGLTPTRMDPSIDMSVMRLSSQVSTTTLPRATSGNENSTVSTLSRATSACSNGYVETENQRDGENGPDNSSIRESETTL